MYAICPSRRDVRIPIMTRENGEQDRPEDINGLGGVGTLVGQRTLPHSGSKQVRRFETLDTQGQLAQGRHGRRRIPFAMNPSPIGVDGNRGEGNVGRTAN